MKKLRILSLAMAAALSVSLLAGCSNGTATTPEDDTTSTATGTAFKIGGTAPLTGDASIYGLAVQRGAQIAVDEINAKGGSIQFELKYEDDVNDPEKAVNAYNTLKD